MYNLTLVKTGDGSHTLLAEEIGETYHSRFGAVEESNVVYIHYGYHSQKELNEIYLLEIGFGTGLNCLLTALEADKLNILTHYYTIEKYPLPAEITNQLNYTEFTDSEGTELWHKIHQAPWTRPVRITPLFELRKIRTDIMKCNWSELPDFNLVYFDAFGPEKQPDLWNIDLFRSVFAKLKNGSVFVTYSAKGSVRRDLQQTGFKISRLPGPAGKREILMGIKI